MLKYMDELSYYIFSYYSNFLTEIEDKAYRNLITKQKIENSDSDSEKKALDKLWISKDKKVLNLLSDGEEIFYKKTVDRILKEHKGEVFLNYCKKCGKLTRTPKAKQCFHCGYD